MPKIIDFRATPTLEGSLIPRLLMRRRWRLEPLDPEAIFTSTNGVKSQSLGA
ncbi:hypothetical protein HALLA_00390 (plasmid) [Halostagnicola larsenii XH-48]|uniref:Uncharacterized protein n=1 Tax=Halostagnicola larsenii XH-48 TaxID=797299 RepID=W0JT24_9EURY|nr:hypothetical protein HALLA_00390 [Halostagnicola larsenii XH-48]